MSAEQGDAFMTSIEPIYRSFAGIVIAGSLFIIYSCIRHKNPKRYQFIGTQIITIAWQTVLFWKYYDKDTYLAASLIGPIAIFAIFYATSSIAESN